MEPITIQANLNSNATRVVSFTNPLDTPTHFHVTLSDTQPTESFCLLLKRTHGILLQAGVSLDIPVMFAPEEMSTHTTTIVVSTEGTRCGSKLVWRYPVIGEPHFRPVSPKSAPRISCRAKERVEERLEVVLVGKTMSSAATLRPLTPTLDPTSELPQSVADGYSYDLVCEDAEHLSLVQDCVAVKLLRKMTDEEGCVKLMFGVVFVPPKALRYAHRCTVYDTILAH